MTLHKEKICACGHAASFHENRGAGRCTYGHDKKTGGCRECSRFHRRARPANGAIPILDSVFHPMMKDGPLSASDDPTRFALVSMIRALDAAKASLVESVRVYNEQTSKAITRHGEIESFLKTTPIVAEEEGEKVFFLRAPASSSSPKSVRPPRTAAEGGELHLKTGERLMLTTLVSVHPRTLSRIELGATVGLRARGTTFGRYLSTLRSAKLVGLEPSDLRATAEGLALVRDEWRLDPAPPSRAAIVARWTARLKAGERAMLDWILAHGPTPRKELGEHVKIDPSGTTFGRYLSTLKGADLLVVVQGVVLLGDGLDRALP